MSSGQSYVGLSGVCSYAITGHETSIWFSAGVAALSAAVRYRRTVHTRQRLCSASSTDLVVPRTNRSTIGEWSFQSAAAFTWNALPRSVRYSTSVFQFRSRFKTELFARSYQQSY